MDEKDMLSEGTPDSNELSADELLDDILNELKEQKDNELPVSEISPDADESSEGEELPVPDDAPEHEQAPEQPKEIVIFVSEDDESDDFDSDDDEYDDDEYDDDNDDEYDDNDDDDDDDDDEYYEEHKKKKRRRKGGRLIFALVLVTFVISVAIFGALFVITVAREVLGLEREDMEFSIEIPPNSGTEAIADILYNEGIIERPVLFRIMSKIKGADGTYIAGIHKVNPNMTYGDLIESLQDEALNPREFVTVTFPEGIRLIDAAQLLEENGVCDAKDFIKAFNSTEFGFDFEDKIKASPMKFYKMEGLFFPDTYEFYLDEDPKNIVKKVFKNFDYRVTRDYYGRMDDLGLTFEETLTLASIVQAEAARSIDMKLVASVFHNRLNNPDEFPLLQSDPTTAYVREVIRPNMEIYSQSICDAYDTYKGGGLPPGPICNPGIEAIEAVLYPRETDYYFFCSNLETGEFFFAKTLEEHEANLIEAGLVTQ